MHLSVTNEESISLTKKKFIEKLVKLYCIDCQQKYGYKKFDYICCCYYLKYSTTHNPLFNDTCCYVCCEMIILPTDYLAIHNIECRCLHCKCIVKFLFNNQYRHSVVTLHDYVRSLENN